MWRNGKNFPPKEGNSTIVAVIGTRHSDSVLNPVSMRHCCPTITSSIELRLNVYSCAVTRPFSGGPKVFLVKILAWLLVTLAIFVSPLMFIVRRLRSRPLNQKVLEEERPLATGKRLTARNAPYRHRRLAYGFNAGHPIPCAIPANEMF
jgi:hypothetical protein